MGSNLSNRVMVITGASSGIGAATALACADQGMRVVLAARRLSRLEDVARRIRQDGRGAALPVVCDVRKDDDVEHLFQRAMDEFGQIDAVFANAGYGLFQSIAQTPDQAVRDIFETNFHGTLRCIRLAVPIMRKQGGGHLLICTSACSEIGLPMYGFYSATKAAQDSIGGALRAELAGTGIHVTTVHPIGTQSEFFEKAVKLVEHPGGGLNTPAALMHTSEKVARAVVRCLKRPKSEVWPSLGTRFGVAITTAFPFLSDWSLRRIVARRYRIGKTAPAAKVASPGRVPTVRQTSTVQVMTEQRLRK